MDVRELSPAEVRVLGCLIEKELTTPQQYPLTLNALVLACNQSSNRDPVVAYDEGTVEEAVTTAKTRGLCRFVHPSHGRSALRYRHELADQLGLDRRQLALLAVLMLRGPQTPGELRSRTERMAGFDTLGEVEAELEALVRREEPLVARLPRQPGRKEDRFVALLGPLATGAGVGAGSPSAPTAMSERDLSGHPAVASERAAVPAPALSGTDASVMDEIRELRAEIESLRRDLDDLRRQLGA